MKVRAGPIPDPETLKELTALYPEAPKVIFEEFHLHALIALRWNSCV